MQLIKIDVINYSKLMSSNPISMLLSTFLIHLWIVKQRREERQFCLDFNGLGSLAGFCGSLNVQHPQNDKKKVRRIQWFCRLASRI